ncbi:transmembrane protein 272-like [Megalops cyprinoides]|uniref:transmembrane protein 272-like n=1 Tax=Megalops cyprinoides TaxID=118141 RepID=UPI001863C87C|nr:transmembrane protein 272-like [Megalops cyprinoides]
MASHPRSFRRGSQCLHDCPKQPYIPIYLIVSGVFYMFIGALAYWRYSHEEKAGGNVWIYSIYPPIYNQTQPNPEYSLYLHDCPKQPYIPIYLIVSGVFCLLVNTLSYWSYSKGEDGVNKFFIACSFLYSLFSLCWFIAGNVWIYSIYPPSYNQTQPNPEYCNKTLYLFAFWTTTLSYINKYH